MYIHRNEIISTLSICHLYGISLIFKVLCDDSMSVFLSHPIYSKTVVPIVTEFDKNVWSVIPFTCSKYNEFVLSLTGNPIHVKVVYKISLIGHVKYQMKGLSTFQN